MSAQRRAQYEAHGQGLLLSAPKVPTGFVVTSTATPPKRLRVRSGAPTASGTREYVYLHHVLLLPELSRNKPRTLLALQAADLKVSIRGSAMVRPEVQEREDGALQVRAWPTSELILQVARQKLLPWLPAR
jgi:hypothetical protein